MTLHDELKELVDTFGQGLLGDADQFRAALDDYLPENAALPGQLNVLYDAVRFGAYHRCVDLLDRGSDPMLAVSTAGDLLARERGTTEVITSRWAVASLAHATGHLATDALSVFLQPDTAGGPVSAPTPSLPTPVLPPPPGPPPVSPPPGPPPSYPPPQSIPPPPTDPPPTANPVPPPPPTYVPPVETAPGTPSSRPTSEQPPEPMEGSTPAPPPPSNSEPVPEDLAPAPSVPAPPQTVTAPLGRVAVPAPPGTEEPRRRSRRAGLIAAAAVAALVAAGVGTYVVVANGDEDSPRPTAKDSAGPSSPSTSDTGGSTSPPAPPDPPAAPKLTADPAYRAVAFAVKGDVVGQDDVLLERWSDDGWTETEPRFTLPTDEGGQQVCARVRGVRTDGAQSAPGPAARLCGKSKPTTIRWVRSDTDCPPAQGLACYAFDLQVTGFEPGKSLTMEIVGNAYPPSSTFYSCAQNCTKKVKVNDTGRGNLTAAVKVFSGSVTTLKVAGQQSKLDAPQ